MRKLLAIVVVTGLAALLLAALPVSDTFNEPYDDGLGGSSSAWWVQLAGWLHTNHGGYVLGGAGGWNAYIWSASNQTVPNDQYAQIALAGADLPNGAGVILRGATGWDGYVVAFNYWMSPNKRSWYIGRADDGSITVLKQGSIDSDAQAGDVVYGKVVGTTITIEYKRGATTLATDTATDSTYSSGQPGITILDNNSYGLDNFEAGSAASAATPRRRITIIQ